MVRVVITGIGSINPLGNNFGETWNRIVEGKRNFEFYEDLKIVKSVISDNFNDSLSSKDKRYKDRVSQLATLSTEEAVKDSKISKSDLHEFNVSVGTSIGGVNTTVQEVMKSTQKGIKTVSIRTTLKMLPNMIGANITIDYGIHGTCNTYSSACASGSVSLGEAFLKIRDGFSKGAIVVGAESCLNDNAVEAFKKLGVLSSKEDLKNASTPFGNERSGFVISEGSTTLILESLNHAKLRNAPIYCEVTGYGNTSDGYSLVAPSTEGMKDAMNAAIDSAHLTPGDVNYINAHGTATKANDEAESKAINEVFNGDTKVSSTKTMLGHMLGGSGAIEAALCAKMLKEGFLIKQYGIGSNLENLDHTLGMEKFILEYSPRFKPNQVKNILSNSFAFGGINSVLAFRTFV